jgi:hypothetical protein
MGNEPMIEGTIKGIRIKEPDPANELFGTLTITIETQATEETIRAYSALRGQSIVILGKNQALFGTE